MSEPKKSRIALKIILPILILLLGVAGLKMLSNQKKAPQRQKPPQQGILVDVITLNSQPHQVTVYANGTVTAEQEIALVPEVNGKIVWLSPQMVNGGLFNKGDIFFKVDPTDYQLAVERARAEIARAEVALRTEQEKARIALQEWERIELDNKGKPGPLVTREIQLQQEQANLAAAKANLKQAELNLQRTTLTAPFDGRIRQEQVDLGQFLRSGNSIGSFVGTARAEIHVPLPFDELRWLTIPQTNSQESGSSVSITLPGGHQASWQGRIVRSLGEIDQKSRMATVIVQVDDPYQMKSPGDKQILHNGQFVDIRIHGQQLENIISIPRSALRSGQQVWIADQDNRLRQQPVQILRREKQQLIISEGIEPGDRLILTTLAGAANGLQLRPVVQEQK